MHQLSWPGDTCHNNMTLAEDKYETRCCSLVTHNADRVVLWSQIPYIRTF